jgi:hypothetical protein
MLAAGGGRALNPIEVIEAGTPWKGEFGERNAVICAEAADTAKRTSADVTSFRTGTLYLYLLDTDVEGKVSVNPD